MKSDRAVSAKIVKGSAVIFITAALSYLIPWLLFASGSALAHLGAHSQAVSAYSGALALGFNPVECHLSRGLEYMQIMESSQALVDFSAVTQLKPDDPTAMKYCGLALMDLGRSEEALEKLETASRLKPDDASLANLRGVALMKLKRLDQAKKQFENALRIDPGYTEASLNRTAAEDQLISQEESGIGKIFDPTPSGSKDKRNFLTDGIVFCSSGEWQKAIDATSMAIAGKPSDSTAYIFRARAYLNLHQYDNALKDMNKAVLLSPSADTYSLRGRLYGEMKLFKASFADFDKAIALNPNFSNIYMLRAIVYEKLGQRKKAEQDSARNRALILELAR